MEPNKFKLCLVTIWTRGSLQPFLVEVPVDASGKAEISEKMLNHLTKEANVQPNARFGIY